MAQCIECVPYAEGSEPRTLREILEALGELAQGDRRLLDWLGHELRNPLAAIELAVRTLRQEEMLKASVPLEILERQTIQLGNVIGDLLETAAAATADAEAARQIEVRRHPRANTDQRHARWSQPAPVITDDIRGAVLLAEDNDDLFDLLHDLLTGWQLEVIAARDGAQAIELGRQHRPPLCLVDVGLPLFDGHHVARELRRTLGRDTRLLAMSGYGRPEDRSGALSAGFDEFLVKPIPLSRLRQEVEQALAARPT